MNTKDKIFLAHADAVTETYQKRIAKLQDRLAQVKGGNYTLGHIRDFRTAMQNEEADLGIFVVTSPPSRGMETEASRSGTYNHPSYEFSCPKTTDLPDTRLFREHFTKTPPRREGSIVRITNA